MSIEGNRPQPPSAEVALHRRPGRHAVAALLCAGLALAGVASGTVARAAIAPVDLRRIAIAEDRREWNDGTLRGYLSNDDAETRARAVLAVGRLQDTVTVGALLPLLGDSAAVVRRETAFALGQIGDRSAREALEKALDDPDQETVQLAIEALGKLGDKRSTPRVMAFLRSDVALLRETSAVALWHLADSTALGRLLERHDDPDPEVRWRVLYALEKINAPDQIVLIAALHQDDDNALVRAHAARTLGREKSVRATSYLLQMIEDPSVSVRINVINALRFGADSTSSFTASALTRQLGSGSPYLRLVSAQALGDRFAFVAADSASRAAALDSLRARLGDPDPATRGAAAVALLRQRGVEAWADVEPLLHDEWPFVRGEVLDAAAVLPGAQFRDLLVERLSRSWPRSDRMAAALGIAARGDRSLAPLLRPDLYDLDPLIAEATAVALEQMADTASVPSLLVSYSAHASDRDASTARALLGAIGTLRGKAFADSLKRSTAVYTEPPEYPDDFGSTPTERGAIIHTSKGDIELAFEGKDAPLTVKNFVHLARGFLLRNRYFHRVVPDFVIQDGDPTGTGWGGPGYTIRCEYNRLRYGTGMVGMALSGKDTGGSQWFITQSPQPHLNGRYTIFARVVRGMDVVQRIVQGDRIEKIDVLE